MHEVTVNFFLAAPATPSCEKHKHQLGLGLHSTFGSGWVYRSSMTPSNSHTPLQLTYPHFFFFDGRRHALM